MSWLESVANALGFAPSPLAEREDFAFGLERQPKSGANITRSSIINTEVAAVCHWGAGEWRFAGASSGGDEKRELCCPAKEGD